MPPRTSIPRWFRSLSLGLLAAAAVIWGSLAVQFFWFRAPAEVSGTDPTAPVVAAPVASAPVGTPTMPGLSTMPVPTAPITSPQTAPVTPGISPAAVPSPLPRVQQKYRHFAYAEAPRQRLVLAGRYYDRTEYLDQEAAAAFKRLQQAALNAQVKIMPISGFRTVVEQEALFRRQIQRQGSPEQAAMLSAPPGYSEHHTGYALDISDGNNPKADLRYDFADTPAYRWLKQNAMSFAFEESFPDQNRLGVVFEPWHWRYIGSSRALEIFAASRQAATAN
jgi:zinc D-Ala-D-Ala carboxypeptidase